MEKNFVIQITAPDGRVEYVCYNDMHEYFYEDHKLTDAHVFEYGNTPSVSDLIEHSDYYYDVKEQMEKGFEFKVRAVERVIMIID